MLFVKASAFLYYAQKFTIIGYIPQKLEGITVFMV